MRLHLRVIGCLVALISFVGVLDGQTERSTITLGVDATDAPRHLLHARETIAVHEGPLTLLYPKWIPGEHGPTGPILDVAGPKILAAGKVVPWRRDLEEMYAIHVEVPPGTGELDLSFDYIIPPQTEGFSSGASASPELLVLSWNQTVFYPSGPKPDKILVSPTVRLPRGWKYATALTTSGQNGDMTAFQPVTLDTLVDSPLLTGAHFRRIDLTPPGGVPHFLDMVADNDRALAISARQEQAYRNLIVEANTLFGGHHYNHYDFLYTLSDHVAHFGLEHHQSSDDRVDERTVIDENVRKSSADLLPHEFVHSWNGKYRRPAGLATGDFSTPMKTDLLWVYEGLTQYLGKLLAARSGLRSPEEYEEDLAFLAARLDNRPGREWRTLQDTNDEAQLLYYARTDWDALRRDTDFYDEGDLIWLEVDVIIRQLTQGRKSLDDFCRVFHGGASDGPQVVPYTFDDVVAGLNSVAPYDWRGFFETHLRSLSPRAPLGGIEKAGWRVVYTDTPNGMQNAADTASKTTDLRFSIGLLLGEGGIVRDVIPDTAADRARLAPGMIITAVNRVKYSPDTIRDAVKAARTGSPRIELIASNADQVNTYSLEYQGGERYPHLERDASTPDLLAQIMAPRAK